MNEPNTVTVSKRKVDYYTYLRLVLKKMVITGRQIYKSKSIKALLCFYLF